MTASLARLCGFFALLTLAAVVDANDFGSAAAGRVIVRTYTYSYSYRGWSYGYSYDGGASCSPGWGTCPGESGCTPLGSICCGDGEYCGGDQICIGNHQCLNRDSVRACSDGRYCEAGYMCMNNGKCLSTESDQYCGGRSYCDEGYVCQSDNTCKSQAAIDAEEEERAEQAREEEEARQAEQARQEEEVRQAEQARQEEEARKAEQARQATLDKLRNKPNPFGNKTGPRLSGGVECRQILGPEWNFQTVCRPIASSQGTAGPGAAGPATAGAPDDVAAGMGALIAALGQSAQAAQPGANASPQQGRPANVCPQGESCAPDEACVWSSSPDEGYHSFCYKPGGNAIACKSAANYYDASAGQNLAFKAAACLYYCLYNATNNAEFQRLYSRSQKLANNMCSVGDDPGHETCNNIEPANCKPAGRL